jgi:hypothetical protein
VGQGRPTLDLAEQPGGFVVRRQYAGAAVGGVKFSNVGEQIVVESMDGGVTVPRPSVLNGDGECRIRVNGEELRQWQVLQRAS